MRQVLIAIATIALASGVQAQTAPVPVEQMTCEQLLTEMDATNGQLEAADAIFTANASDAEAQANAAMGGQSVAGMVAKDMAMGLACAVPGVGMACMVVQGAQGLAAGAQAQQAMQQAMRDSQRMLQQHQQVTASIDMNRMQTVMKRVQEKCAG